MRMKPEHWMHALDSMEASLLERIADEDGEMPPSSEEPGHAENMGHMESDHHEPDGDEGGIMIVIGGKPMMEDDEELKRRLGR
jgi:hypothetical protein